MNPTSGIADPTRITSSGRGDERSVRPPGQCDAVIDPEQATASRLRAPTIGASVNALVATRRLRLGARLGLAAGVAAVGAVITGWATPHGPYTTSQALLTMVVGGVTGIAAGVVARARSAIALAPAAFALMYELVVWPHTSIGSADWIITRAFLGLVGTAPTIVGATFGVALARRADGTERRRHGWSLVNVVARRAIAGASTLALGALAVAVARPADPGPIRAANGEPAVGGLVQKIRVEINGVDQGMFIEATNPENPVLLVLHGGPGMPEHWLTERYPTGLERHFTVVWWEQRGAGLSYTPAIDPATMTIPQFVADTLDVTRYLLDRFDRDQLYLLGHSWGSFIGLQAVEQAPELYAAYVGVGQVVHQIESEQLAYDHALDHFEQVGDQRMVDRLRAAPPGTTAPLPNDYMKLRDEYMHRAGIGTMHDMRSVVSGIFIPSLRSHDYTIVEKVNLWRGKIDARRAELGLWDTMLTTDMRRTVPAVDVPVYFFHGKYDYTCAQPLAADYLNRLDAPVKRFYTFEHSAHSPLFEEPEKTVAILLNDVLA